MRFLLQKINLSIYFIPLFLLISCSTSRYININDAQEEKSVKLFMANGETMEGLITEKTDTSITLMSAKDFNAHILDIGDIRHVEKSQLNYDFKGKPISNAEIEKYKSNRNAWGYAIGGAVLGGVIGIVVDLPLWHADVGIAPYFMGGIGATAGSIFFGLRGIQKDREIAVEKVRYLREMQKELEDKKTQEERHLAEIRKETEELKQKIKEKDNEIN
jgi:hypothetical protein